MKNYKISNHDGQRFYCGMIPAANKLCSVPRFPKPTFERIAVKNLIEDPARITADEQFGPEWIVNQGQLGSCTAWATCGALARSRERNGLNSPNEYDILSGEYLYSRINQSRDQGSTLDDAANWISENGVAPYRPGHAGKYKARDFSQEDSNQAARFKAEVFAIDGEMELATALALGYFCVVAVEVNRHFHNIKDGVIDPRATGIGNHAVLIHDLRIDKKTAGKFQFQIVNSWGKNWGDNGTAFCTWENLEQTNKRHYFFAISSTSADPADKITELRA